MAIEKAKRKNRSTKYPFSKLDVGKGFTVSYNDYNAMQTSLRNYNKRHGLSIAIARLNRDKDILITRIS